MGDAEPQRGKPMNQRSSTPQPKAPAWAWPFVVACSAIPVVSLGGAIPAAIGGLAAVACYGLARDGMGSVQRRVLSCGLVTLVAWGAFGTLAWAVSGSSDSRTNGRYARAGNGRTPSKVRRNVQDLTEEERREIYADAIELRTRIENREQKIEDFIAAGRNVRVLEKQLVTMRSLEQSHLKSIASRNKISRHDLDAIVEEGDTAGWD